MIRLAHHSVIVCLGLAISAILASCAMQGDESLPIAPEVTTAFELSAAVDADGDGFPASVDCLDEGFYWRKSDPVCSPQTPLTFVPGDGANVKDFALVEDGATHHLIHIRGFGPWGTGDNETDFGHETTTDFVDWTMHPPIELLGAPGDWNDRNVWAPNIVTEGGTHYMFFTGVTYTGAQRALNLQRVGLATSTDLFNWSLVANDCDGVTGDGCLLDCESPFTLWGSGQVWTGSCRDPFVMKLGNLWVMYLTIKRGVYLEAIAFATSTDLTQGWTLQGFLPETEDLIAESPSVIQLGSTYYLFWSVEFGIAYASAPQALGPWTVHGLVNEGFAGEAIPLADGSVIHPFATGLDLSFTRLVLEGPELKISNITSPLCRVPASAIHPGAIELPNGIDDNCDGYVDGVGPELDLSMPSAELWR